MIKFFEKKDNEHRSQTRQIPTDVQGLRPAVVALYTAQASEADFYSSAIKTLSEQLSGFSQEVMDEVNREIVTSARSPGGGIDLDEYDMELDEM